MYVLVVNAGSSSLKLDAIDPKSGDRVFSANAERLGTAGAVLRVGDGTHNLDGGSHSEATAMALPMLMARDLSISAVAHRVVHGGETFSDPVKWTPDVQEQLKALTPLAPLHQPANLSGIEAMVAALPEVPHVVVFDTAFHSTLPRRAKTYALPRDLTEEHGIRRFGFHGPSHAFVAKRAAEHMGQDWRDLRIVTCHLGSGASVCAVEYGRSVETSMGMTPLEGLVMRTRSGDLDPGVILHLLRHSHLDLDEIDDVLNRDSGLAGLSGTDGDWRELESLAAEGDDEARLAIQVFAHRLRKTIGSYVAAMGGVDAIVFTAGIGENSAMCRQRTLQRLDYLGARLDDDLNRDAQVSHASPVAEISHRHSRVRLLVVKTDEALYLARQAARIASMADAVKQPRTIPIACSARHVHLTREAVDILFGKGHQLTPYRPLSQPGQYACEEKVDLIGPKRSIEGVRVLGPERPACQVEVSRTDEFHLGLDAPVRASGDVKNTPGITLVGPEGQLTIEDGVICAWRHIHMTPEDAEAFGVNDKDIVEVEVNNGPRKLIFGDVLVRVKSSYRLEMHIDTDEANAAELMRGAEGSLVNTEGSAVLRKRRVRHDSA